MPWHNNPRGGSLVVLARCHGNNTYSFWSGKGTFHDRFTGTSGNIHISWLGKLSLSAGTPTSTCYVAEYTDGMENTGAPYADPNLDGWPSHNAGWPNLNTTRCSNDVRVDSAGRVYVSGVGRRTITTANAFQKMLKKPEGVSAWNSWVRVYSDDFKSVLYSSLLTGRWDKATRAGADNTHIASVCPTSEGVLAPRARTARSHATTRCPRAWCQPGARPHRAEPTRSWHAFRLRWPRPRPRHRARPDPPRPRARAPEARR